MLLSISSLDLRKPQKIVVQIMHIDCGCVILTHYNLDNDIYYVETGIFDLKGTVSINSIGTQ